jgi:radical SAM protein with 4Fe4S-binding SPASM domain
MSKNFCSRPWDSLFIHTNGGIRVCCHATEDFGNINTDDINEVLKNEKYAKMRQDILNDRLPRNCFVCKHLENSGYHTARTHGEKLEKEIRKAPDVFTIKTADIRWDNTCNLTCTYCNSEYSSSWQQIDKTKSVRSKPDKIEKFKQFFFNNKESFVKANLLGGEPFLLKHNIDLLNNIKKSTVINLVTNLSIPNLENNKLFNLLKDFETVRINVSFENIGKKYEYVRHGADWEIFNHNLKLIRSIQNFKISANPVYHALSGLDIMEYLDYCSSIELDVRWVGLVYPPELNAHRLPVKLKEHCIDLLNRVLDKHKYYNNDNIQTIFKYLQASKNVENDLGYLKTFLKNQEMQLSKTTTFTELWGELND